MDEMTDADLMIRVRSGDRQAFGSLVDRHKDAMVNYLTRLTGCRETAEDVAQEAFVRLYHAAGSYREEGRLGAYLYRIATNVFRQQARRRKRWRLLTPFLVASSPGGAVPAAAAQPQENVLRSEVHTHLTEAIAALPVRYRVPVVLRDVEGWAYADIARATGSAEGTVKSRISRGRALLRQKLEPYWHGHAATGEIQ